MIEAGRIKGLGVTGTLPPPFDKRFARIEGLDVLGWNGVVVAKGTPASIRERLAQALSKVLDSKDFGEAVNSTGQTVLKHQGDAFRAFVLDEVQMWEQVMQKAGLSKL